MMGPQGLDMSLSRGGVLVVSVGDVVPGHRISNRQPGVGCKSGVSLHRCISV